MKMRLFMPGVWCLLLSGAPLAHADHVAVENCWAEKSHMSEQERLKKIVEYKKSDHELVAGYFRMWNDVAFVDDRKQKNQAKPEILSNPDRKVALTDIPDCLDMVMTFTEEDFAVRGSASLKKALIESYVPTLHKRGTKVIGTIWPHNLKNAYDYVSTDTTEYQTEQEKYERAAQMVIDLYLTPFGFDGLDVDTEESWPDNNDAPYKEILRLVAGKLHARGKLLIFDNNTHNLLLESVGAKNFDYVLLQSYGYLNVWAFNEYVKDGVPADHILLGFSFYEEKAGYGNFWGDTHYDPKTGMLSKASHAYLWSQWEPSTGHKGGVFSYALDRDGVDLHNARNKPDKKNDSFDDSLSATTFPVSRYLVTVMPPVKPKHPRP